MVCRLAILVMAILCILGCRTTSTAQSDHELLTTVDFNQYPRMPRCLYPAKSRSPQNSEVFRQLLKGFTDLNVSVRDASKKQMAQLLNQQSEQGEIRSMMDEALADPAVSFEVKSVLQDLLQECRNKAFEKYPPCIEAAQEIDLPTYAQLYEKYIKAEGVTLSVFPFDYGQYVGGHSEASCAAAAHKTVRAYQKMHKKIMEQANKWGLSSLELVPKIEDIVAAKNCCKVDRFGPLQFQPVLVMARLYLKDLSETQQLCSSLKGELYLTTPEYGFSFDQLDDMFFQGHAYEVKDNKHRIIGCFKPKVRVEVVKIPTK